MRARIAALRKSEFAANLAKLAGGTGVAHVITIAATPILTRLYDPSAFGALAVYTSLMFLTLPLSAGRYQVALPLAEDDSTATNLLVLSISLLTAMTVAILVVVIVFGDALASALSIQSLRPYLWLLPVSVLAGGLYDIFTYWATRTKGFTRVFATRISQAGGQAAAQIAGGLARLDVLGLVGGHVLGRTIGAIHFMTATFRAERAKLSLVRVSRMVAAARRYKRFPLIYAPSTLINVANLQLVPIVVTSLFGPEPAGFFGLATRVVFVPLSVIGGAVAQVFYNRAASLYQTEPARLPRFVYGVTSRLAAVTAISALVLMVAGPQLFKAVFGAEWEEAGRYARILAVPQMLQFVYSPISQLFNVFERQSAHLIWSSILVMVSLSALYAGSLTGSIYGSLILFACGNALLYGSALLLFARWLRNMPVREKYD